MHIGKAKPDEDYVLDGVRTPPLLHYSKMQMLIELPQTSVRSPKKKGKSTVKPIQADVVEPMQQKPFAFLGLPMEIRLMVYSLVSAPEGFHPYVKTKKVKLRRKLVSSIVSDEADFPGNATFQSIRVQSLAVLLSVNRQIHSETKLMLYAQPIHFCDNQTLSTFLIDIGPLNRAILQDITVNDWGRSLSKNTVCLLLRDAAKKLRSFYVKDLVRSDRARLEDKAEEIFEHAAPLLEAIGRAHGRSDAGLDIFHLHPANFFNLYPWSMEYREQQQRTEKEMTKIRAPYVARMKELLASSA